MKAWCGFGLVTLGEGGVATHVPRLELTCFPFLGSDAYLGSKACYKVGNDIVSNLGSDA